MCQISWNDVVLQDLFTRWVTLFKTPHGMLISPITPVVTSIAFVYLCIFGGFYFEHGINFKFPFSNQNIFSLFVICFLCYFPFLSVALFFRRIEVAIVVSRIFYAGFGFAIMITAYPISFSSIFRLSLASLLFALFFVLLRIESYGRYFPPLLIFGASVFLSGELYFEYRSRESSSITVFCLMSLCICSFVSFCFFLTFWRIRSPHDQI